MNGSGCCSLVKYPREILRIIITDRDIANTVAPAQVRTLGVSSSSSVRTCAREMEECKEFIIRQDRLCTKLQGCHL
jgi:hypothetical protein